jgi:hypothetical protein
LALTLAFASIFFAIFALAPLAYSRFHELLLPCCFSRASTLQCISSKPTLCCAPRGTVLAHLRSCAVHLLYRPGIPVRAARTAHFASWDFAIAAVFAVPAGAIRFIAKWITIGWLVLATGFLACRRLGLAVLAAVAVKVFASDLWGLERGYRIVSYIALGVL